MAGSASTITYDNGSDHTGTYGGVKKIMIDWTSDDTTGAVSATTGKIVGQLIKVVTDPGATAPTTLYDIAITDEEGVNVLGNCVDSLADRHASNTEEVYLLVSNSAATDPGGNIHPSVCDKLTVAVTNAGNSKQGQIIIYYR